jgi:hypothetical protein
MCLTWLTIANRLYGSGNMHGLVPNIKMGKLKRKKKNNQEAINEGHKGLQVSMKSQGDEGLLLLFHIETIFLTPNSW